MSNLINGDDLYSTKRYESDTTHMVVIKVISKKCKIGDLSNKYRLFLNDLGFSRCYDDFISNNIEILVHATVNNGVLSYDQ